MLSSTIYVLVLEKSMHQTKSGALNLLNRSMHFYKPGVAYN
jgi:hypothetical protein